MKAAKEKGKTTSGWLIIKLNDFFLNKNKEILSSKKLFEEGNHQPRVLYSEEILCKKEGEAKTCSGKQKPRENSSRTDFYSKGKRNMFQISSGSGVGNTREQEKW